jgi:chitinase
MWDYKALPLPGSEEVNDHRIGASYSYDRFVPSCLLSILPARHKTQERLTRSNSQKRLLISYDTQAIAIQKADYIKRQGLGGAMWWELDADKAEETGGALVRTVKEGMGGLEWRENELGYGGSSKLISRFLTSPKQDA